MAATETEIGDTWVHRRQWRDERMRFRVLVMLYETSLGRPGQVMRVSGFAEALGAWREELFRAVEYLDGRGYITYHGAGPQVSLTPKGIEYLEQNAGRRKSLRE